MRRCALKNMKLSVKRIEEMVTRKTVPNGRRKPAKKAAETAKSSGVPPGASKKNESRDSVPASGTQGDSLILDGTSLDSVVYEEPYVGRPRIEIFFGRTAEVIVDMRTTRREVADEL